MTLQPLSKTVTDEIRFTHADRKAFIFLGSADDQKHLAAGSRVGWTTHPAAEIILAMVDACENPPPDLKVDADSFGEVKNGICVGCIATSTIINAGNINPTNGNIELWSGVKGSHFLYLFEEAIDFLRIGDITSYNLLAEDDFAQICDHGKKLPEITTENFQDKAVLD